MRTTRLYYYHQVCEGCIGLMRQCIHFAPDNTSCVMQAVVLLSACALYAHLHACTYARAMSLYPACVHCVCVRESECVCVCVCVSAEPEPTGSDGKRWLAADIKQAMTAKRIRAELRMLETAAQQCNGKQIPQHTHTLAAEAPDSTAGPTAGDAADAYQAAIQQAIKHLRAHQAEDKKQAKALRKALEQLAVDGSAILSQARGFTTPVDEATPEHPGRPRKKKKKKGAQDGSAETVPAEPLRKVDGTVIEARVDVPRDVRISKLLGTSTS